MAGVRPEYTSLPFLFIIDTCAPSGLESIDNGQFVLLTIVAQLEKKAEVITRIDSDKTLELPIAGR